MDSIPVIDFGECANLTEDISNNPAARSVADNIRKTFSSVGFCYLKNHGIPDSLLNGYLAAWLEFFKQTDERKQAFIRGTHDMGWSAMGQESLNPSRPGDLKEAYNFNPHLHTSPLPSSIPRLKELSEQLFKCFHDLAFRLLDILSMGMQLDDLSFFKKNHKLLGKPGNFSKLRTLYYPPIDPNSAIKPGQIRLGEHSDYGTITLLYQDNVGGLEVQLPRGEYVAATPIPGTILINIGDMMQRWTSDKLVATKHRVTVVESEVKQKKCRQSVAFFVNPDDDCVISCVDGSGKYPPVRCRDYLDEMINATY